MKRRLFNIVTAISLLLCVVMTAAWMRSVAKGYVEQTMIGDNPRNVWMLTTSPSSFSVERNKVRSRNGPVGHYGSSTDNRPNGYEWKMRLPYFPICVRRSEVRQRNGLEIYHSWFLGQYGISTDNNPNFYGWTVRLPYFPVIAIAAVFPACYAVRWWRRCHPRKREGLCPQCGYDLRASPERCPECGTPIPVPSGDSIGRG